MPEFVADFAADFLADFPADFLPDLLADFLADFSADFAVDFSVDFAWTWAFGVRLRFQPLRKDEQQEKSQKSITFSLWQIFGQNRFRKLCFTFRVFFEKTLFSTRPCDKGNVNKV